MGWSCGMYGGKERWLGDLREGYHLEYLSIDGRIILKWIFSR